MFLLHLTMSKIWQSQCIKVSGFADSNFHTTLGQDWQLSDYTSCTLAWTAVMLWVHLPSVASLLVVVVLPGLT